MRRLALLACLWSAALAPAGDDWPQFRGPDGDGRSDARSVPVKWSESENVLWKTEIHDKGWSSPVVLGDQVWLTTARKDGTEMYAVCVDRKSGKITHDIKVFADPKPAFCHEYNSYATPTPVLEAGRVYVHFGSHGTACLDSTTGKVLWQRTDLKCNHFRGPGSSPVLHGDLLVLTFDGFDAQYLVGLDKNNGKTVWRRDRELKYSSDNGDFKKAYSTPAVIRVQGKDQLVSPSAEFTVAYDPATGEELWRVRHGGMNAAARPVAGHGLIFLTSGHTKQLLAIRLGGTGDITGDVAWKTVKGVPSRPSLLLVGDLLFLVNDEGIASCLEAKTGKQLWQERLKGPHCASPLYAAGNVYFCDENGQTTVVEAAPTYKLVAANKLDTGCMASPAVAGDNLLLRTKTRLYCIGSR